MEFIINSEISFPKSSQNTDFRYKITVIPLYQNDGYSLATVDNNDTVSYGCIRVALELQPSKRKMQPLQKILINWN